MQPSLALTYNSQGGNGLLGMGWSLSGLSAITRCPQTMATDGNTGGVDITYNDRYCLDGQRLILVSGTYGYANSEYRTERDTLTKIVAYNAVGSYGPAYFIAKTKSGQTIQYGVSTDARIIATGKTTALVWNVNRITDTVGNYLTVTYTQNTATGEYYPQRIDYAGNSTQGTPTSSSVQFVYATRTDTFTGYVGGSIITNSQRLSNVRVYEGASIIRDYQLVYNYGPSTGRSQLSTITECDGSGTCLSSTTLTWVSTANQFGSIALGAGTWNRDYTSLITGDYNGDGKTDFIKQDGTSWGGGGTLYLSKGDGTFTTIALGAGTWNRDYTSLITGDYNGDGKTDFIKQDGTSWGGGGTLLKTNPSGISDLMSAIANGLGATTTITYKPLTDSTVYTKGTGAVFPQQDFQGPMYVVSQFTTSDGVGGSYPVTYSYQGARVNVQGRGFSGFSQITAADTRTGITTRTTYADTTNPTNWPLVGLATSVTKTYGTSTITTISAQSNTLSYYRYGTANAYYYFPYVPRTVVTNYELPPSGSSYVVSSVATNNYYRGSCATSDAYCDLSKIEVISTAGSDTFVKTTYNSYDDSGISNWILGRLINAKVTSTLPSGASLTRESSFSYDPTTGLLLTEVIEPNGNVGAIVNMKQTTTYAYAYNGFVNKTGATVSGADGISRLATAVNNASTAGAPYAYSAGRFETGLTNAASQGETRVYDARFGTVATLTGPNNLSTNWQYDNFGRKQIETRADGTITIWSYSLCGTCANAKYYVTQTTPGAPTVTVYYDLLDREVRTETQGYNGTAIYKDTVYNNLGQIAKVSRPYYNGDAPYWTYFSYDALGRVTSQSLPTQASSAGTLLGKTDYNGLTTVLTQYRDGAALTTIQVKDVIGELVSVTDANNNTTSYQYDPFGNLTTVADPALNVTSMTYDIRGRKLSMTDPDMGYWQYSYNSVGELTQQIDAKGQTVTMTYDRLGRMYIRNEAEGITFWTYDDTTLSGAKAQGKLSKVTWPGGNSRTYVYDGKGRPRTETTTLSGVNYTLTTTYDSSSRVDTITYPSGFSVRNNYNANGYLNSVTNTSTGFAYWTAPQYTAAGQVSAFTLGNNLTTVNQYDPGTGLIMGISTGVGTGSATQYLNYNYDALGNLLLRYTDRIELFSYDNLNRMTSASIPGVVTKSLAYDSLGNITSKSDVGSYTYDPQHIHAVKTAGSGSYTYDANGNQLTGTNGRSIGYTSFNQPLSLTQGGKTNSFVYDGDHQRVMETTSDGTTITIHPRIDLGAHYEEVHKANGTAEYKNYIYAGKDVIAVYTTRSNNANDTRYFHKDHLGSIDTITNETGQVVERLSYDAWGKRRNGNWTDATTAIGSITHHGFTGHEHLDDVGLINMNGRIYDPTLARFLSADPTVQSPGNPQTLNRYTYAGNNPLSYTDPSGYSLWTDIRDGAESVVAFVAGTAACGGNIYCGAAAAGAVAGYKATGTLQGTLTGAAYGLVTAGIFQGIGDFGQSQYNQMYASQGAEAAAAWGPGSTNMVILHAAGGGVASVLQGGKFGPGALSAGFSEFAGPRTSDWGSGEVVKRAVLGGTASVMGGGKFANGAATAAFAYLFNNSMHRSISNAGLQSIANSEGFSSTIYPDQAGNDTIGYGHKLAPGESALYANGITRDQAFELLRQDVGVAALTVNRVVTVPLSQPQFDALVSFTYNVGSGNFASSTLLQQLNRGNYSGAAGQFLRWNRVTINGQSVVSDGLVNRRADERCMFMGGC
ncbi:MAG: glycoside hydrolase family protein [Gammaproteobacteria bacterium]